jgi:sugar lactone lactonase YvrE
MRFAWLGVLLLTACASQPQIVNTEPPPVWPAPPETPRIAYVRAFSQPEDMGITKSFFTKIYELVVGSSDLHLIRPMAVMVTPDGTIYVADPGSHGVQRFDAKRQKHRLIQRKDSLPLPSTIGLAVDSEGDVYVTDSALGEVFVIKPDSRDAIPLTLDKPIQQPTGIAFDPVGKRLYIVDTTGHQIRVVTPDGKQISTFGRRGNGNGEFNFPTMIWRDRDGRLYVTDSLNFRIQIFDSEGRFLGLFGRHGDATGDLSHPKGVTTDRSGHVYVMDSMHHALQIFNRDGDLLLSIGNRGRAPGEFWLPAGAFMSDDDLLYIADSYNQRIQVFQYIGDKP